MDRWRAYMNSVEVPVDGFDEHGVETSGWLLRTWRAVINKL
jgi:hypothetical protein